MGFQLGELFVRLGMDISDYTKGLEDAQKELKKQGEMFANAGEALSKAITLPLGGLATASVVAFAGFEQSMNKVLALGGKEIEPMFERLQEQAMKLGMETKYSAKQAADAMGELAAAGFKGNEIMAAMPGLLSLAATENMKLADAAKISSSVLRGFGIDASKMQEVADILAQTAAASATSIQDLGYAFQYVGPVARTAGQNMLDVSAALGVLGNAGIRGETAGTALRNMFNDLLNPMPKVADAMKTLGINVKDTAGKLLPLGDLIKNLTPLTNNMALGFKLFGQRFSDVIPLIADGGIAFRNLRDEVGKFNGAADAMAKTMQKGIAGNWEKFTGNLEQLAITVGKVLAPAVNVLLGYGQKLIDFLQVLVTGFSKLPDSVQTAVVAFLGLAAAIGPAMFAIGTVMKVVGDMSIIAPTLTMLSAGLKAFGLDLIAVQAAVGKFSQAVITSFAALKTVTLEQLLLSMRTFALVTVPQAIAAASNFAKVLVLEAVASVRTFATVTMPQAIAALVAFSTTAIPGAIASLTSLATTGFSGVTSAFTSLSTITLPSAAAAMTSISATVVPALIGSLYALGAAAVLAAGAFAGWHLGTWLRDNIPLVKSFGDAVGDMVLSLGDLLIQIPGASTVMRTLSKTYRDVGDSSDALAFATEKMAASLKAKGVVVEKGASTWQEYNKAVTEAYGALNKPSGAMQQVAALNDLVAKYGSEVRLGTASWKDSESKINEAQAAVARLRQEQAKLDKEMKAGAISPQTYQAQTKAIKDAIDNANSFSAQLGSRFGAAGMAIGNGVKKGTDKAVKALGSVQDKLNDITENIPKTAEAFGAKFPTPAKALAEFERLTEFINDAQRTLDRSKGSQYLDTIKAQVKAAQDQIIELAKKTGLAVDGNLQEAAKAWDAAKRMGLDPKGLAIAGQDNGVSPLSDVAKKTEEDTARILKYFNLIPEQRKKLIDRVNETKYEAQIGISFKDLAASFKAAGVSIENLREGFKNNGLPIFEAEATAARDALDKFNKTGIKSQETLNALETNVAKKDFAKSLGMSFAELDRILKEAGVTLDETMLTASNSGANRFSVMREKIEKELDVLVKTAAKTGQDMTDALQKKWEALSLAKWEEKMGKSLTSVKKDFNLLGVSFTEFEQRIKEAGTNWDLLAKAAEDAFERMKKLPGILASELLKGNQNLWLTQMASQAKMTVTEMESLFAGFGLTLQDQLSRLHLGDLDIAAAKGVENFNKLRDSGIASAEQIRLAYLKMEGDKTRAALKTFESMSIAQDGFQKVWEAGNKLAMMNFRDSILGGMEDLRKNLQDGMRGLISSLFTFDAGKISEAAQNLGKLALDGLKKALVTPFMSMFETVFQSISMQVTKLVTDKITGLLLKGFEKVFGIALNAATATAPLSAVAVQLSAAATQLQIAATQIQVANGSTAIASEAAGMASKSASTAAEQVTKSAGTVASTATTTLSKVASISGIVTGAISAVTGVLSYLQGRRMEKDIGRIEVTSREIKAEVMNHRQDQWKRWEMFVALNDGMLNSIRFYGDTAGKYASEMLGNLEQINHGIQEIISKGIATNGSGGSGGEGGGGGPEEPITPQTPQTPGVGVEPITTYINDTIIPTLGDFGGAVAATTQGATTTTNALGQTTTAATTTTAALGTVTDAATQAAGSLGGYADQIPGYLNKSVKDLAMFVKAQGSSLEESSELVEHGMSRIIKDTKTGFKFLVDMQTNTIKKIYGPMEEVAEKVTASLGTMDRTADGTVVSLNNMGGAATSFASTVGDASSAISNTVRELPGYMVDAGQVILGSIAEAMKKSTDAAQAALLAGLNPGGMGPVDATDGAGGSTIPATVPAVSPGYYGPVTDSGVSFGYNNRYNTPVASQNVTLNVNVNNADSRKVANEIVGFTRAQGVGW